MKRNQLRDLLALCLFAAATAPAAVLYVDINSTNSTPPYTSWATAATNIQDAVDAAVAGDQILVTNGVYQTGVTNQSRVVVDKPVTVQSVNGPQFTTIEGGLMIRCVYLANGTFLAGFTLTNGNVFFGGLGGGVAFGNLQSDAIVSNCVIVGCAAGWGGGAASALSSGGPPGINGGTLLNCTFKGNLANGAPGGFSPPASGGAADGCKLINCTITGNTAAGPSAAQGGGASSCVLQNCLLTGNSAAQGPGGGAAYSDLINCTVVSNTASFAGGTYACSLRNDIVYYNSEPDHAADNYVRYSCTTPLADGPGNITNAPLFVDATAGSFRLQTNSPCINAGNNDYVTDSVDFEGKERIVGGIVDMGAYEWIDRPTHYVSLTSPNPRPPYLSWSTAATNIQHAVNAASFGDAVLVTNGIYQSGGRFVSYNTIHGNTFGSNRLWVSKALRVESVNGPTVTSIVGYQIPGTTNGLGAIRCAYLVNGAVLSGFTLTNGATESQQGGGVYCESTDAVVSNCVITGNAARLGGGSYRGTLRNCTLIGNSAHDVFSDSRGGGAYGGTLINCVLADNAAAFSGGGAAGSNEYSSDNCTLNNCTLEGNTADYGGGAAYIVSLKNCIIRGNSASQGGGVYGGTSTSVSPAAGNCLLIGNRASVGGGGAYGGSLGNCTVVGNASPHPSVIAGVFNTRLYNCIVYDNNPNFGPTRNYGGSSVLNYCCTTPLPPSGIGNITNAPLFVDQANANLRLQSNSPCINAGPNGYNSTASDLDGNPRVAGGTIDIGAYEFQSPASVLSYAWAQQYSLPTDGSADYSDSDSDRMNNWQEWIAGTVPTDALSALRLFGPTSDGSGVTVSWQSVSNRTYFLERAANLGAAPAFSLLTSNIVGQAGTTSYTDTNAIGSGPFFYRVGVSSP